MEKEIVPGFPSYRVTAAGEVWSMPRLGTKGGIMTGKVDRAGYRVVTLTEGGKQSMLKVATLVALAFLGPKPEGMEVRHLNGNNADDRVENLAYGTKSENTLDQVSHGTHRNARKTHCPDGHEYDRVDNRGGRYCLACTRRKQRERRRNNAVVRASVAE